ncbi:MAG: thiamine phosphate synthase [Candidatus Omnitrophica bacterium]|nr:thiamine phosphate synthase [Candidatus Omnitrophota bacterium]
MKSNGLLYIIIDRETLKKAKKNLRKISKEILKAEPDFIQLRLNGICTKMALNQAQEIHSIMKHCRKTKLLINDRVDIAKAIGADGVHLGTQDLPAACARTILGKKAIIGKTAHSLQEALQSLKEPVDYISLGPAFKTRLKPELKPLGIKKIKEIVEKIKAVNENATLFLIGGITLKNIYLLTAANIKNVALASGVLLSRNPKSTIGKLKKIISN